MTKQGDGPRQRALDELVKQLLLGWRMRCESRGAPWELAVGPVAREMCASIAWTLEHGIAAPDLARTVRAWGSRVGSPVRARACLQCLAETVTDVARTECPDVRPADLDPVLEQLALESAIPADGRIGPPRTDQLTGCPDRQALVQDLGGAVAGAAVTGDDVTVAVLELSSAHVGPHGLPARVDETELLRLLATVRQAFGARPATYRVARGTLAVLAVGEGLAGLGELILQASLFDGPRFSWGKASLHSVGEQAAATPDALLLLAESDLVLRRQEMSRVTHVIVRRRRLFTAGSVAAALLVVSGVGLAMRGSPPLTHGTTSALGPVAALGPGSGRRLQRSPVSVVSSTRRHTSTAAQGKPSGSNSGVTKAVLTSDEGPESGSGGGRPSAPSPRRLHHRRPPGPRQPGPHPPQPPGHHPPQPPGHHPPHPPHPPRHHHEGPPGRHHEHGDGGSTRDG